MVPIQAQFSAFRGLSIGTLSEVSDLRQALAMPEAPINKYKNATLGRVCAKDDPLPEN
jgi:hypothetical protein